MTGGLGFRVLDAAMPQQRQEWEDLWREWPEREVFAHPSYLELFCRESDRALCLIQRTSGGGGVLFPLIQRRLGVEPWAEPDSGLTDVVSPYGYGGPYRWGEPDPAEFWRGFESWARDARVVCCFMRLSVIDDQLLRVPCEVEVRLSNVIRDLDPRQEDLWMDFEHKVRKNVKRAQRAGLEVVDDPTGARVSAFTQIYEKTMDRRAAPSGYYFGESFFVQLIQRLPGQFCFFHCCQGDRVVSTELVLVSERTIYSFLGGTLQDAFPDRPNDLLKHHIILWAKAQGKRHFVLGGGFHGDDGIFRYKRSFSPGGVVPFRVGSWVLDVDAYDDLCRQRGSWESRTHNAVWEPSPGYFPRYRG